MIDSVCPEKSSLFNRIFSKIPTKITAHLIYGITVVALHLIGNYFAIFGHAQKLISGSSPLFYWAKLGVLQGFMWLFQ